MARKASTAEARARDIKDMDQSGSRTHPYVSKSSTLVKLEAIGAPHAAVAASSVFAFTAARMRAPYATDCSQLREDGDVLAALSELGLVVVTFCSCSFIIIGICWLALTVCASMGTRWRRVTNSFMMLEERQKKEITLRWMRELAGSKTRNSTVDAHSKQDKSKGRRGDGGHHIGSHEQQGKHLGRERLYVLLLFYNVPVYLSAKYLFCAAQCRAIGCCNVETALKKPATQRPISA